MRHLAAPGRAGALGAGVVLVVRRDDLADQLVAYDVVRGEPVERDVLDVVEDAPRRRAGRTSGRSAGRSG